MSKARRDYNIGTIGGMSMLTALVIAGQVSRYYTHAIDLQTLLTYIGYCLPGGVAICAAIIYLKAPA